LQSNGPHAVRVEVLLHLHAQRRVDIPIDSQGFTDGGQRPCRELDIEY